MFFASLATLQTAEGQKICSTDSRTAGTAKNSSTAAAVTAKSNRERGKQNIIVDLVAKMENSSKTTLQQHQKVKITAHWVKRGSVLLER